MMNKIILTICCLFFVGQSYAQEVLTLQKAITKGLANNYDIRIQKSNIEVAENNNSLGEAGYLPNVSLNINQNNTITDNVRIANPFQLQGQIISNSLSPQVALNWQLFNGFSAHISKSRLETLQHEAEGNADIVISNTVQAILLGYYRAVLEAERMEEFKKQLNFSVDRYEYIKIKAEFGSAMTNELLLEETNYLTDSAEYINQMLNYENALRDLNFLMGVKEVDTQYELVSTLEYDPKEFDYAELSSKMYDGNVDLKKQYLTNRILEYDLALRRAERYPSLNFNAGYFDNRSRNDLSNAYQVNQEGERRYGPSEPLNAVTDYYFANLTLSFTLFNGNKINRAIKNAVIREDIQNISTDKLKNSLNRDLSKAVANYNVKKQLYLVNAKKEEVARLNLELSEEKFKSGTINSFDYRTVQNNYLTSSIQRLQSAYNLIDAEVTILRLSGDMLDQLK
ncbi:MAG: TolC family protein [Candidatus Cyclobacteriaceae bacterium M2_1C_046]